MLESGARLGNYEIAALLGQGGMGVVYEALQLSLSRRVALKVIASELSRNDRFQERFRREGRSQAALDHPNVVTVHDFGEAEGLLFISMQLVRGPSLKELIHRGELDLSRVVRIMRPIADALDTAHEEGMIHRDFKPQNILVGSRDHAYLADFGLTQALGEPGLTRTGQFVGTLDYIAPEQIHGKPATRRSDVYSFGAVLFECLTGKPPYVRESDAATLFAHVSEPLPSVAELRPGAPAHLDDVLNRAMAKDPELRLPTATAVMDELAAAIGDAQLAPPPPITGEQPAQTGSTGDRGPRQRAATTGFGTPPPPSTGQTVIDRPPSLSKVGPRPKPPRNRKPMFIAITAILVAICAVAGAALSMSQEDTPKPDPVAVAHENYVNAVDAIWKPALTRAMQLREQFAAADIDQRTQQEAADGLAQLYGSTAREIAGIRTPAPDRAAGKRFVAALDDAREWYATAGKAITNNSPPAFDIAVKEIGEAEDEINAAVKALYRENQ
jgi:serine/threonine-protein kinase